MSKSDEEIVEAARKTADERIRAWFKLDYNPSEGLGEAIKLYCAEIAADAARTAYRVARAHVLDEAAAVVAPTSRRPCACDRCDCGNQDNCAEVAV